MSTKCRKIVNDGFIKSIICKCELVGGAFIIPILHRCLNLRLIGALISFSH